MGKLENQSKIFCFNTLRYDVSSPNSNRIHTLNRGNLWFMYLNIEDMTFKHYNQFSNPEICINAAKENTAVISLSKHWIPMDNINLLSMWDYFV